MADTPWSFPTKENHPAAPDRADAKKETGAAAKGSPERELAEEQKKSDRDKALVVDRAKGLRDANTHG